MPMIFVRCAFCHKLVFRPFYRLHRMKHTKLRPDGQMADHITIPLDDRYHGPIDAVPQKYRHSRCGVITVMPEGIVRSYLVNPFLYSACSFCCGCNDYVPFEELFWDETGQSLTDYFKDLQQKYLREHGKKPPKPYL